MRLIFEVTDAPTSLLCPASSLTACAAVLSKIPYFCLVSRFWEGQRRALMYPLYAFIDEIDKVIQNSQQGDPAAAMLEVLDPGQNATFVDHFLNMPFDLSQVLFIATANSLESISGPLRDRMEVVHLSGYTMDEKLAIARAHLLPKQTAAHGLSALHISDDCLNMIIENYTQESGVRNLDRTIAAICRYQCHRLCEDNQPMETRVEEADLENILGVSGILEIIVDRPL